LTQPRRNLITDVAGLLVGNADDTRLESGVTVALFDEPAVMGLCRPGGAPGDRDTAWLAPEMSVDGADAVVLSGGSGFGLDAASGVQAWLRERGRGFQVGHVRVPIVPSAICFDLLNGGNKDWGRFPPYRELAYEAAGRAGAAFALGSSGAGLGATTADLKGGLGSASSRTRTGLTVGALAVVNALGSAVVGGGPHFWAAPWERDAEFGGLGAKPTLGGDDLALAWKGGPATTIALVATDASLTKAQAARLAIMASAGLARALRVTFAPLDGDTVFAAATGRVAGEIDAGGLTDLGASAADCLARAIARGVFAATALALPGAQPSWGDKFGGVGA
jgi:L-aminopeptidase/D-esterase-like protein